VYFTTCIVYIIVVWLFLCTIALLLLQVRRESSAAYIDGQRQSKQSTLRSTAQLVQRMSLQLSFLAILVVVCFFFRAGYAFPPFSTTNAVADNFTPQIPRCPRVQVPSYRFSSFLMQIDLNAFARLKHTPHGVPLPPP
jgi:hypothetical protein